MDFIALRVSGDCNCPLSRLCKFMQKMSAFYKLPGQTKGVFDSQVDKHNAMHYILGRKIPLQKKKKSSISWFA